MIVTFSLSLNCHLTKNAAIFELIYNVQCGIPFMWQEADGSSRSLFCYLTSCMLGLIPLYFGIWSKAGVKIKYNTMILSCYCVRSYTGILKYLLGFDLALINIAIKMVGGELRFEQSQNMKINFGTPYRHL